MLVVACWGRGGSNSTTNREESVCSRQQTNFSYWRRWHEHFSPFINSIPIRTSTLPLKVNAPNCSDRFRTFVDENLSEDIQRPCRTVRWRILFLVCETVERRIASSKQDPGFSSFFIMPERITERKTNQIWWKPCMKGNAEQTSRKC